MDKITEQESKWLGLLGREYTYRNVAKFEQMNERFKQQHGISRSDFYEIFLNDFDRSIGILEVGSNIGTQLVCMRSLGFKNLYGIELQHCAIKLSRSQGININIIQGTGLNIPFKDECFDLVFTCGLLIHIDPQHIDRILSEIYRCTDGYILGYEYYADQLTEVAYRGHKNLL